MEEASEEEKQRIKREIIGSETKITYNDGERVRALRGIFKGMDDNFVYLQRDHGNVMIAKKTVAVMIHQTPNKESM